MANNHKEKLEQAQKYVDSIKNQVALSKYRQGYHFMAPASWINDPNGFIQYKGKYHLFYQYNPYDSKWGSMYWGHAESEDLIKWNHLPIALAPSEFYDDDKDGGCFSGSAVDDNGVLTLMYTGTTTSEEGTVQVQCIATSDDGVNFEKFEGNPVILPNFIEGNRDFRDPKVWKEGDLWYVVIGTTKNNEGRALLYSSCDLRQWNFVSVLAESHGELGSMWECPDFFKIGDKHVLMLSPMELGSTITMYLVGDMDYSTGKFTWTEKGKVDFGFDFYAPQSLVDDKGRRIVVGWANSWPWMEWFTDFGPNMEDKWNGSMSLPREVKLDERTGKLKFIPVEEIRNYRKEENKVQLNTLNGSKDIIINNKDRYEMLFNIDLKATTAKELIIKLRENKKGVAILRLDIKNKKLIFDRNNCDGYNKGIKSCDLDLFEDTLSVNIFSDNISIEVFTDDNKVAMSNNIYPLECINKVNLEAVDGEIVFNSFDIWRIEV